MTASTHLAAAQFGIYRAEWDLEAEPAADPRPAIQSLLQHQLQFHAACQSIDARDSPPEMARLAAQARDIPREQVEQLLLKTVTCLTTWHAARAANDFTLVAEAFTDLIAAQRAPSQVKASNLSVLYGRAVTPYEALLDNYDPGRQLAFVTREFTRLVAPCQALLRDDALADISFPADTAQQRRLIHGLLTGMGYDASPPRGKLGTSAHPFTRRVGPQEVWLTGRASGDAAIKLTDIITMIHEGAHGRYYQGLPAALADDWRGMVASETINEGMALLTEHLLARRKSFAAYLSDQLKTQLDYDTAPAALHAALTSRAATRLRTDASEPSYPLHLILRTELETALIDGTLDPRQLPAAWAAASQRLLGFAPENDNEGCLQDIHLFAGYIGYFPCYLLGHMAAAQLWGALARDLPEVETQIAAGDFMALNAWLQDRIYRHGRMCGTDDLLVAATGHAFSADALLAHLQARYD